MMGIENTEGIRKDDEIEIDISALLHQLLRFWWTMVLGVGIGICCAWFYTTKCMTPMYSASSMVYMRGSDNDANPAVSLQELQVSTELTNDYEIIFKSRPIMEKVIKALDLKMSYKQLAARVEISNPTDTRILKVSIKDKNPKIAKDIVNKIVYYGMESVEEIDSKEPYLIEEAIEDHDKVGPNLKMNVLIGGLVGGILVAGIILLQFLLNDRIVSSDDVEKYLELPVLCEIMEDDSFNYQKRGKKNYGKNRRKSS